MDTELYAMQQLQRRIVGWRVTIAFCFVSIAAHLGWILYLAIDAKFGALAQGPTAKLMVGVQLFAGFVPPLLVFGALGIRVGKRLVERRLPLWIAQIAQQLGVEPRVLEAIAAPYRSDPTPSDDAEL